MSKNDAFPPNSILNEILSDKDYNILISIIHSNKNQVILACHEHLDVD